MKATKPNTNKWKPLIEEWLDIELTNGNDGRGNKWFSSAKVRKKIEQHIRENTQPRTPIEGPVVIELTRILGPNQRLWDSDSKLRGNAKELIDAMVACNWLHDDGPEYVIETVCHQDNTQRDKGPSVLVQIFADQSGGSNG